MSTQQIVTDGTVTLSSGATRKAVQTIYPSGTVEVLYWAATSGKNDDLRVARPKLASTFKEN